METLQKILELVFPRGTFVWFDVVSSRIDGDDFRITFEEKDEPPLLEDGSEPTVLARKFHDITVTDFPIRGRRTLLTFRRRYWKIEGREAYLKRDIDLCFPGTQLEAEFAAFLKETCRRDPDVALLYRPYALPPFEGI